MVECRRDPDVPLGAPLGVWPRPSSNPSVWALVSEGFCPQHTSKEPKYPLERTESGWGYCEGCEFYWRLSSG
jgi:hypothetical protein